MTLVINFKHWYDLSLVISYGVKPNVKQTDGADTVQIFIIIHPYHMKKYP